jgi:hypothetical protein
MQHADIIWMRAQISVESHLTRGLLLCEVGRPGLYAVAQIYLGRHPKCERIIGRKHESPIEQICCLRIRAFPVVGHTFMAPVYERAKRQIPHIECRVRFASGSCYFAFKSMKRIRILTLFDG